jgi:hypothetical protein
VSEAPCHTHFQHLEYGQETLVDQLFKKNNAWTSFLAHLAFLVGLPCFVGLVLSSPPTPTLASDNEVFVYGPSQQTARHFSFCGTYTRNPIGLMPRITIKCFTQRGRVRQL